MQPLLQHGISILSHGTTWHNGAVLPTIPAPKGGKANGDNAMATLNQLVNQLCCNNHTGTIRWLTAGCLAVPCWWPAVQGLTCHMHACYCGTQHSCCHLTGLRRRYMARYQRISY